MDEETAEALTRTKALYDAGVLTEEEYNAKKRELLNPPAIVAQPPANEHGGVAQGHVVAVQPQKVHPLPPPLDLEGLYTGPRSDGLLSTDEISGDYRRCCFPLCCNWMTVVPHGPDMIEKWSQGFMFVPCLGFFGPMEVHAGVQTRKPGTNGFGIHNFNTWFAHGTASIWKNDGEKDSEEKFTKLSHSQKKAFQKVETRDLAGKWCGCACVPCVPAWPCFGILCTTKKALDEDRYEESGLCCWLGLPIPISKTRTRKYVHGHPTNGFANDGDPNDVDWHRDPGCAGGCKGVPCDGKVFPFGTFYAKKVG